MSKVDVLLGLQWGDEGKGKVVDVLTPHYDIIARFQGGPNAGHTLEFNGTKHVLHIIPSGIFHENKINLIGNGVLIDPSIFEKEVDGLVEKGVKPTKNLFISKKAHLILPTHRLLDAANEQAKGDKKIGSTLKGIGPAYTDKISRMGLRVGDVLSTDFKAKYEHLKAYHISLAKAMNYDIDGFRIGDLNLAECEAQWMDSLKVLKGFKLINSEYYLNDCLSKNMKILAEGAQGTMLDVDFGSYPFVTSSNTITAGVCSGLGVAPSKIGKVIGISKAYCTRVGSGAFPTELFDEDGDKLRNEGNEFGSTTGRSRRCGWIDLPALKYACMLDGVTDLFITKIDVLNTFETIKLCDSYSVNGEKTEEIPFEFNDVKIDPQWKEYKGWQTSLKGITSYEALPENARNYLEDIEKQINVRISAISTSPDRKDLIMR